MIESWISILHEHVPSIPIGTKPFDFQGKWVEVEMKNMNKYNGLSHPFVWETPKYLIDAFEKAFEKEFNEYEKKEPKQIKEKKIKVVRERKYKTLPKNEIALIYKITNKITGKIYIGQTIQHFGKRWCDHFYKSSKSTAKFHKEIRSYKKTDWTFEIIEEIVYPSNVNDPISRQDYITERERYYIILHDSIKNGYNTV